MPDAGSLRLPRRPPPPLRAQAWEVPQAWEVAVCSSERGLRGHGCRSFLFELLLELPGQFGVVGLSMCTPREPQASHKKTACT